MKTFVSLAFLALAASAAAHGHGDKDKDVSWLYRPVLDPVVACISPNMTRKNLLILPRPL